MARATVAVVLWAGAGLVLAACNKEAVQDGGPPEDAGVDAGPDAGEDAGSDAGSCDPGAHRIADGTCDSQLVWDAGAAFSSPRDHHVTFLVELDGGAALFVTGGNNYAGPLFKDTWTAPVAADGTLGAWTAAASLPSGRAGHSAEVIGDEVIVTSGKGATGNLAEVLTARVQADGTLTSWTATTPLPFGRFHHATASRGNWIYLTGGLDDSFMSSSTVVGAEVQPDGTIAQWQSMSSLPGPRDHHSSFTYAGQLYVVGGGYGNPVGNKSIGLNDIWAAPIQSDGSLGSWAMMSTIDVSKGIETQSNLVYRGHLYVIGGIEALDDGSGGETLVFTNHVRRAPIADDGTIGTWEEVAPLPLARGHVHQTPLFHGNVYSVSGSDALQHLLPAVSIGLFE